MVRRLGIGLVVIVAMVLAFDALFYRGELEPPHLRTFLPLPASEESPQGVVLLVNGGLGSGKNHRRYWNNLSLSYIALKSRGWKKIVALDADGDPAVADRNGRSFLGLFDLGERIHSPLDLDEDGALDVSGPATKVAIAKSLEEIGRMLAPNEPFVLYLIDHGQLRIQEGKVGAVFMLWNEELRADELARMLDAHIGRTRPVALLGSMCHSSMFFRELHRPNTLFISAGRPLWIWSDQDYGVFAYHFAAALRGKNPSTGAAVQADGNGDGRVSFREALASAITFDHSPEWPAYWSESEVKFPPEF